MEGSTENGRILKDMILRYCRVSVQRVNEVKTNLSLNRDVDSNTCKEVEDVIEIASTNEPGKYLGIPTV